MRSSSGAARAPSTTLKLVLTRPPLTRSKRVTAAPGKTGASSFANAARSSAISARSRSQLCLMFAAERAGSMPPAAERGWVREAAHARTLEHRQLPMAVAIVDAQDVGGAVVALDLDVAVIRTEPLIEGLDDADPRSAQAKALRHRHAAMSGVGVDPNLHASGSRRPRSRRCGRGAFKHSAGPPPTHPSWRGGSDCIKQDRATGRSGSHAEPDATSGREERPGRSSMLSGRKVPYRAAKLVVAGSMLALAASLAGAQQPQAPAPTAPTAPAAPAPQAAPAAPQAPPAPAAQNAPAIVPPVPASTPEQEKLRLLGAKRYPGKVHVLPATLETTQWGWFNNAQPPVLHVDSGDTILFETMMHSHNQVVPGATIEQIKKLRTDFPGRGPHTLTGPVYIEGAEPGDVLKVRINRIVPRAYGTNFNVPGMFGQFPGKFPEGQVKYFYLDLERKIAEFAPGIEIPLAPFPGTIGVARAEPGQYSSVPPGRYAGNPDIRDETEGSTLYVPVFVKGALLWTGDSHAAQGNGEINLTALETAYKEMNVTVDVLKNTKLEWPRIETKDSWITVGIDRDLNKALDILKEETTTFLMEQRKLTKDEAAKVMMATWDCRVTQVVDVNKGLHCFSAKNTKERRRIEALPEKENKSYLVTVGRDADLNKAMDDAAWAMIGLLEQDKKLSRLDAYSLASMVMDCRLAAPGAEQKAVHCLVPKSTWVASR